MGARASTSLRSRRGVALRIWRIAALAGSAVVLLTGCIPLLPAVIHARPSAPSSAEASAPSASASPTPNHGGYASPQRSVSELERIVTAIHGADGTPLRLVNGDEESASYWSGTLYAPLDQFRPSACETLLKHTLVPVSPVSRSGASGEEGSWTFVSVVTDPERSYSQALRELTEFVRTCPRHDVVVNGNRAKLEFTSVPPPKSLASRTVGFVGTIRPQNGRVFRIMKLMAYGQGLMISVTRELGDADPSLDTRAEDALAALGDSAFLAAGPESSPTPLAPAGQPTTGQKALWLRNQ
ncbi:hypothetical protein [Sinomonas sp. ASV322]|uniref:hypothetical protein n=1 Tax=Sinomonas sp. ASV322 TaxID=3041920 RepID=UPI0027DC905F|nr:hypothetical protein [Sinomonas sp. ASV322]MDQ4503326.1 hypothetical protein [Sinomonas sp. ASV322]